MSELDQLAAVRPCPISTDAVYPAEQRARLFEDIVATTTGAWAPAAAPAVHRSRRRWTLGVGLAAVSAAAVVVAGTALPSGSPAGPGRAGAATLERLAVTAAGRPAAGRGRYYAVWSVTTQRDPGGRDNGTWHTQEWFARSGAVWGVTDQRPDPDCWHRPPTSGYAGFEEPSTAFLATVPTRPERLRRYLRAHVHGSSSTDEAVFVAVGDLLRSGRATPALRAAGFRVLAGTEHVSVRPDVRDSRGRTTTRVDFTEHGDDVQSLYFDAATSRVLEESEGTADRFLFRTTTVRAGVVAHLPAAVARCAADPDNHGLPRLPVR